METYNPTKPVPAVFTLGIAVLLFLAGIGLGGCWVGGMCLGGL